KLGQWLKYADDFEGSRHWLERARQEASDGGDDHSLVTILINPVILACSAGRWSDARTLGEELVPRFVELGWETSPTPHIALVASVRTTEALSEHAGTGSIPWNRVIAARSRALIAALRGDVEQALQETEAALREHEALPMPFELGRTLLVKGQIERRAKRKA